MYFFVKWFTFELHSKEEHFSAFHGFVPKAYLHIAFLTDSRCQMFSIQPFDHATRMVIPINISPVDYVNISDFGPLSLGSFFWIGLACTLLLSTPWNSRRVPAGDTPNPKCLGLRNRGGLRPPGRRKTNARHRFDFEFWIDLDLDRCQFSNPLAWTTRSFLYTKENSENIYLLCLRIKIV